MFEMGGITEAVARDAINMASFKIGVRTKFVTKH
jgi:ribosomal protein L16/L10AE